MGYRKITDKRIKDIRNMVEGGFNFSEISKTLNIPMTTVRKWSSDESVEVFRKQHRNGYSENKDKLVKKARLYRKHNKERLVEMRKEWRWNKRIKVLSAYCDGELKCSCVKCNETNPRFLSIDHINNDGADHRKSIGGGSYLYDWLIKNDFPKGFRVMCYNCNLSLGFFGICHE